MGIDIANIVIDPGIGFGKNKYHNLDILKNISIFMVWVYLYCLELVEKH